MKKLITTIILLGGLSMAGEPDTSLTNSVSIDFDSIRREDSALSAEKHLEIMAELEDQHAKDSILFANKIPDSLRTKVQAQTREYEARKSEIDSLRPEDSDKISAMKLRIDSLRKAWESNRDTQISKIKDTAVQARIKTHIAELAKIKAIVKARIENRKGLIEAKIAELKSARNSSRSTSR